MRYSKLREEERKTDLRVEHHNCHVVVIGLVRAVKARKREKLDIANEAVVNVLHNSGICKLVTSASDVPASMFLPWCSFCSLMPCTLKSITQP